MLTTMIDLPKGEWILSGSESISFQSPDQSTIYAIEAFSAPSDNDLSIGVRISPGEIYSYKKTDGNLYLMSPSANTRVTVASPGGIVKSGLEIDVFLQDQTSDSIILRFNKITNSTTLASDIALHDRSITLASATGVSVGSYLILFNNTAGKVMPCVVTSIAGSPTFAIDRPADYAFPAGTNVDVTIVSMNQNGASAEQVFGLRGPAQPTAVDVSLDINEIRLFCIASSAVDLQHFGDLTALTNGVLVRSRNGGYKNIANMKTNAEILGAFGNWVPYQATNPAQGVDGFVA